VVQKQDIVAVQTRDVVAREQDIGRAQKQDAVIVVVVVVVVQTQCLVGVQRLDTAACQRQDSVAKQDMVAVQPKTLLLFKKRHCCRCSNRRHCFLSKTLLLRHCFLSRTLLLSG